MFTATVSTGGTGFATSDSATLALTDSDSVDTVMVGWQQSGYTVDEGGGTVEVCAVVESGTLTTDRSVLLTYETVDGTAVDGTAVDGTAALAGTHYTAVAAGTLTLIGADASCATVVVLPDMEVNADRMFTVRLTEAVGTPATDVTATLQTTATTVTIVNDDVPVLSIAAVDDMITEGADAQFKVTSSLALTQSLTVSVQVVDSGMFLTETAPTTVMVPVGIAGVSVVLALQTDDDTDR